MARPAWSHDPSKYEKAPRATGFWGFVRLAFMSIVLTTGVVGGHAFLFKQYYRLYRSWHERAEIVRNKTKETSLRGDRPGDISQKQVSSPAQHDGADWSPADPESCTGFFGNGFKKVDVLLGPTPETGDEPQLVCMRHPVTLATVCHGLHMVLHPARITMASGGDSLEEARERASREERPVFSHGATEWITHGYANIPVTASAEGGGQEQQVDRVGEGGDGGVEEEAGKDAEAGAASGRDRRPLPLAGRTRSPSKEGTPLPLPPEYQPGGSVHRTDGYKGKQLGTATTVDATEHSRTCTVRVTEPAIFLTRMEYANLFHTSTDWYNAWSAARLAGLAPTPDYRQGVRQLTEGTIYTPYAPGTTRIPAHIILMDGHYAGPMDEGWTALFLSVTHAKQFPGPVCFDRPILAPFGYNAAISKGIGAKQPRACPGSPHVIEFGRAFVQSLGIPMPARALCPAPGQAQPLPLLFVRRVHYLAHPRHNGQIVRRLDNEEEIVKALEGRSDVTLLNGMFSSMSLREQVQMVQQACVLVGAHGAGLTHILFGPPGMHTLEIQPPSFQRGHFIAYSAWMGAPHALMVVDSTRPAVRAVLEQVDKVMSTARERGNE